MDSVNDAHEHEKQIVIRDQGSKIIVRHACPTHGRYLADTHEFVVELSMPELSCSVRDGLGSSMAHFCKEVEYMFTYLKSSAIIGFDGGPTLSANIDKRGHVWWIFEQPGVRSWTLTAKLDNDQTSLSQTLKECTEMLAEL